MSLLFRKILVRGTFPTKQLVNCQRHFSLSLCRSDKPTVTTATEEKKRDNPMSILTEGSYHKVNNLERRFLVWSGKYKKIEDVPPTVSQDVMEKARNKARIKIANYMTLGIALACIAFIYSGKQAAKRGETVSKMNLDWHKQVDKEATEEK